MFYCSLGPPAKQTVIAADPIQNGVGLKSPRRLRGIFTSCQPQLVHQRTGCGFFRYGAGQPLESIIVGQYVSDSTSCHKSVGSMNLATSLSLTWTDPSTTERSANGP